MTLALEFVEHALDKIAPAIFFAVRWDRYSAVAFAGMTASISAAAIQSLGNSTIMSVLIYNASRI